MTATVASTVPAVTLGDAIGPKRANRRAIVAAWRKLRRQQARQAALYGDTAAEKQSLRFYLRQGRAAQRALIASRKGRRIDLLALLRQRRTDGKPVWALADPTLPVGEYLVQLGGGNGEYHIAGSPYRDFGRQPAGWWIGAYRNRHRNRTLHVVPVDVSQTALKPSAIPPLPDAARAIVADRRLQRQALWIGLLYQPESWMEVRPDPAIVAEWRDRPGEYYALCVWGQDRPGIMEFVD